MNFLEIAGLSCALAMDAFAVAVSNGITIKENHLLHAFRIAFFFGLFQAVMPVLGWFLGQTFSAYVSRFDHWIAFGLLAFVGGRMIRESRDMNKQECRNCSHFPTLLLMSLATSIDALAVGFSFAFLGIGILFPVLCIGVITFILSLVGFRLGFRLMHLAEDKMEMIGGLVLIAIGLKILAEHLFFK